MKGLPDRISRYLDRKQTRLQQFVREGFLTSPGETFVDAFPPLIRIAGRYRGVGPLRIDAWEEFVGVSDEPGATLIRRTAYSFNVNVPRRGNVFRYDSPHSHRPEHHVHRFDPFAPEPADTETVTALFDDDARPTLASVLREAATWAYDHADRL